nr:MULTISPECIES: hypothetical protein [Rhodococcus]
MLKVFAGFSGASRGQVQRASQPVKGPFRNIGYAFQRAALLNRWTVRGNLPLRARPAESWGTTLLHWVGSIDALYEPRLPGDRCIGATRDFTQRVSTFRVP